MAERRMFTKKIVDSDAFLEMPCSAQALYFHLCMRADDDGFVNNPRRIKDTCGASLDDLKLLLAKRFVLSFENGVIVIKHWRMHNSLRKDRYTPTQYQEEFASLLLKDDGAYTEKSPELLLATKWQPNGNQMATQYSIGQDSIVEDSIGKVNTTTTTNNQSFLEMGAFVTEEQMDNYEIDETHRKAYVAFCKTVWRIFRELGYPTGDGDGFIRYNRQRGWRGLAGESIVKDESTLSYYIDKWCKRDPKNNFEEWSII